MNPSADSRKPLTRSSPARSSRCEGGEPYLDDDRLVRRLRELGYRIGRKVDRQELLRLLEME